MKFKDFLNSKNNLKIGFFGGSITDGFGASERSRCYRELVFGEIKKNINRGAIQIAAAIGGTGSNLGLFRLERDLLRHMPDLVFVEFAVNDSKLENTDFYVENIVRNILRSNSDTKIVFLYTATADYMTEFYAKGLLPPAVAKQEKIAEYYGIPSINAGKALYEKIKEEGSSCEKYLCDGCHPNDEGYRAYADEILRRMDKIDFNIDFCSKPINKEVINARMEFPKSGNGWRKSCNKMYNTDIDYVYSNIPGTAYEHEFSGSIIGLYFTMEKDSGILKYRIDGGEEQECSTWDKYCVEFNRDCYKILNDALTDGKHTLEFSISGKSNEKSEGTYIRLGAFLVG